MRLRANPVFRSAQLETDYAGRGVFFSQFAQFFYFARAPTLTAVSR